MYLDKPYVSSVYTVKQLRSITGMTQTEFGRMYGIPLQTIKNWECNSSKSYARSCPEYVRVLLQRAVLEDFGDKFRKK